MIDTEVLRDDYTVSAPVADFNFTFPVYDEDDIRVIEDGLVRVNGTHYTVHAPGGAPFASLITLPAIGFIRFPTNRAADQVINLIPRQPLVQTSDYVTAPVDSERIEKDLDKLLMIARMMRESQARGLRLKQSSLFETLTVDDPAAGSFLRWKDDLTGIEGATPADIADADVILSQGDLIQGGTGGVPERLAIGALGAIARVLGGKVAWLAPGSDGQILTIVGGVPAYATPTPPQLTKGSDIASASSIDIGAEHFFFSVTGTTTITAITTRAAGALICLTFTAALQLTHHATSLILQGGVNRITAAGDALFFVSEGSGNWRQIAPTREVFTQLVLTSGLLLGTNPASAGLIRLPNNSPIKARNAANDGDVDIIFLDTNNRVTFPNVRITGQVRCDIDSTGRLVVPVGTDKFAT